MSKNGKSSENKKSPQSFISCGFASMGKNKKFYENGFFLLPNEALYQAEPRPDVLKTKCLWIC
jgi:hypothetical protein